MAKTKKVEEVQKPELTAEELAARKRDYLQFVAEHMVENGVESITRALANIAKELRRAADELERDVEYYGPVKAAETVANKLTWLVPNMNLNGLLDTVAQVRAHEGQLYVMKELGLLAAKEEEGAAQ